MPREPKPVARLAWFLVGEYMGADELGPNRMAADALVDKLEGDHNEAHAIACQSLASAVDSDPTNAALWGQYRAALDVVKGLADGDDDDALTEIFGGT